jgi:RimJ/RimL family protein N-acetyltransferase
MNAPTPTLQTPRLRLRRWRESDLATFASINADPRVMEFMPATLTRAQSDQRIAEAETHFDRHGIGKWAVELIEGDILVGSVGLSVVNFPAPFTPCVEIGWRLAHAHWGNGYATEAAAAAIDFGFRHGLNEIVSFTVPQNHRSRRVMEKLGMTHTPTDDFDHPLLPEGDRLRRHVLYRLSRGRWTSIPV